MATDAKPKSVQVGDPITVTTTIAGRGNFDRVNAPLLEDDRGWHKYPPSSKFKQDDEVGISGTKTFETVISPNENKQSLPVLAFSYFDPAKEQYVTLHSEPMAITVQGGAAAPNVAAQPPSSSPATAARGRAAIPNSTKPQDILYQLTEPSRTAGIIRAALHASRFLGGAIATTGGAARVRGLEDSASKIGRSRSTPHRCAATRSSRADAQVAP